MNGSTSPQSQQAKGRNRLWLTILIVLATALITWWLTDGSHPFSSPPDPKIVNIRVKKNDTVIVTAQPTNTGLKGADFVAGPEAPHTKSHIVFSVPANKAKVAITIRGVTACGWRVRESKAAWPTARPTLLACVPPKTKCTSTICTPRCCIYWESITSR